MEKSAIIKCVSSYYAEKLATYGPTARGVDWNSTDSQNLRFEKLFYVVSAPFEPFSIADWGCGYGAFLDWMCQKGIECEYKGLDVCEAMLSECVILHREKTRASFYNDESAMPICDYTVASGIFNVKLGTDDVKWKAYMHETIDAIGRHSKRGFAFNVLTLYSDVEKRRNDLYYADALYWFDYCKRHYSRFVSLVHDYPLYEFTMTVKL